MVPVTRADIDAAYERLRPVVRRTPLEFSERLSALSGARVFLKREDLQVVRSYKVRGAYNRMSRLGEDARRRGVVCASAGNHAQGVAHVCRLLEAPGVVFMPRNTPRQKVARVRSLGGDWVRLELVGDTFDDAKRLAVAHAEATGRAFVPPFDDPDVIAGQGTVAREVFEQLEAAGAGAPDRIVVPVGGGGLLSGMAAYAPPSIRFTGVEPAGAPSLAAAVAAGRVVALEQIDTFVDGAAVKSIGEHNFALLAPLTAGDEPALSLTTVPEGRVCTAMIALYQSDGIIAEPAGALTVAALEEAGGAFAGQTVVCVVSGGNNDISRYPEVIERSLVHQGLKHYFLIEFSQRAGALRQYLDEALGPTDDITLFEYVKKNNREFGPALVGVELASPADLEPLMRRMDAIGLRYEVVAKDSPLFRFLV
jgi:threonine dehydratase